MFRIGLIGSENSHARAFARLFATDNDFSDLQVVAVYGEDRAKSEKIVEEFGHGIVVDHPSEMLGMVDAVMITSRDGKFHLPYALPFLEAGIPMFMDKPFTIEGADAVKLVALAKAHQLPLCGGSSLKCCPDILALAARREELGDAVQTGFVSAPLKINSEYSGFYFYASHLIEICLAVFGWEPEAVTAERKGDTVQALMHYPDFDVVCSYTPESTRYFVHLTALDNVMEFKEIDTKPAYKLEAEKFAEMLRSGKMTYSFDQLMMPVFCMNAVKEAYETGKQVAIRKEPDYNEIN